MSKYNLSFIGDEELYVEVEKVINIAKLASRDAEMNLYKNVIDPFSAVIDSMRQDISMTDWLEQEKARQIQKTLQNALGNFHQSVLGYSEGWDDLKVGGIADLRSDQNKIVAEVKNKYNTTKGNHRKNIYDDLLGLITKNEGYIGYYVEIIPKSKKPYDKVFTPSDNVTKLRRPTNEHIRVIDGRSFYGLVTGQEDAVDQLYKALPSVVAEIIGNDSALARDDQMYTELFKKAYPFS